MIKRTLMAVAVITSVAGVPVLAQQPAPPPAGKLYVFKDITPQELGTIGKGLSKLPYEESAALLAKLQQQISQQDAPPPAPVAEPKGKK